MTKTKSTKRALLFSMLSILLCVSMLIGTTFAWFTDTASTSVNRIQAGKLDIALEVATAWDESGNVTAWANAEGQTLNFKTADNRTDILWEPGCTYALPELRIVNKGDLSLKYKVVLTGINGDAELNDVIDWTITNSSVVTELNADHKLAVGASDIFTVSGTMQTTAGNEYQDKTISGIAITVVATQDTVESDMNGNTYDEGAEYSVFVSTPVSVENGVLINDMTLVSDNTVATSSDIPVASTVVPSGTKLDDGTEALAFKVVRTQTPANVQIISGRSAQSFDIKVDGVAGDNTERIKVELYVGTGLGAVSVLHNETRMSESDYSYDSETGIVTLYTTNFSVFTVEYSVDKSWYNDQKTTFEIKNLAQLMGFAELVNDGTDSFYGKTVKLCADIDLENMNWTPIGKPVYDNAGKNVTKGAFMGDFDGQGHTIYNLKVNGGVESPIDTNAIDQGFFGCLYAHGNMAYVQNLNIHNANVYAKNSAGAFVGSLHTYQHINQSGQSNIWNCKLTGKVTIKGGKSGGVCGSPVPCWAVLTSLQNITVNVDRGSYVSNVGVEGAAGNVAGVAAIAAYSSRFKNITSNMDVIANPGEIGGIVAVANGIFENITFTGNVVVKGVAPESPILKYGTVLGTWAPIWNKGNIKENTFTSTGTFTIEYTNGTTATITQKVGARAW